MQVNPETVYELRHTTSPPRPFSEIARLLDVSKGCASDALRFIEWAPKRKKPA